MELSIEIITNNVYKRNSKSFSRIFETILFLIKQMSSTFFHFSPVANSDAIAKSGNYRITVLTSKCIRIEYSETQIFKDLPTLTFTVRDIKPIPHHSIISSGSTIRINTDDLELNINDVNVFPTKENKNITITSNKLDIKWKYGDDESAANLKGTTRTLDEVNGSCPLSKGLISRSGYSVVDDSLAPIINENGTFTPASQVISLLQHSSRSNSPKKGQSSPKRTSNNNSAKVDGKNIELDIYFFGYGHNYNECISDFLRMSAQPPMLPRFAYGIWWSRYWAYTQDEMLSIADDFLSHNIPLKVFVVDMDWHIVKNTGNDSSGWTGYTFNHELIPDPVGLIQQLHDRDIKVTFNLHPADGVWSHETMYNEFAKRMGVEPDPKGHIKFDCEDPKFMKHYFELLHHPLEKIGVDFWWIDWQQGFGEQVDPLIVLNHDHFMDSGRNKDKRPFILSRWCGLGGQRYPIGFSGDTEIEWESLQFQPYFTATASNVGFGFWSHDIGGHMKGHENGELYVRWLQYGALSPILRMHSTSNPFLLRLPWQYDRETEYQAIRALQFHDELTPLFYSLGYIYHRMGIMPVRPTYYIAPEDESAYNCPTQYLLGDDIIVSPIVTPKNTLTNVAKTAVFLPQPTSIEDVTNSNSAPMKSDTWFDFQTGRQYSSGWHMVHGELESIPIFVRGGGIVPTEVKKRLVCHVFPKGSSSFLLYEDDGISSIDEKKNEEGGRSFHITHIASSFEKDALAVTFTSEGVRKGIVEDNREVLLIIRNVRKSAQVTSENVEIVSKKQHGDDCELTIKIKKYPCRVELRKLDGICIEKVGFTDQMLFNYLRRCNLNTHVKFVVYEALKAAPENEKVQAVMNANLLDEQIRIDLLSEIGDFGYYQYTKEMGKDVLVAWNTKQLKDFQYCFRKFPATADNNRQNAKGIVPKALIYEVDKNTTHFTYEWTNYTKVESRLELRFSDAITRFIDFNKLATL